MKNAELNRKAAGEHQGKVGIVHGNIFDSICDPAASVYDSKPFYPIACAQAAATMLIKQTCADEGQREDITCTRLDTIDQYNLFMSGIDRADQMGFHNDPEGPSQRLSTWTLAMFEIVMKQGIVQVHCVHKMLVAQAAKLGIPTKSTSTRDPTSLTRGKRSRPSADWESRLHPNPCAVPGGGWAFAAAYTTSRSPRQYVKPFSQAAKCKSPAVHDNRVRRFMEEEEGHA